VFPATFFDFNGVLVNDEIVHFQTFREVLAGLGVTLSEHDYLQRYLGFDDAGAFRAILEDAGQKPSAAQVTGLIEAKRPLYMARARAALPTFAGAAELVTRRAAAGPALVVSGALRDEIELGLECWACARRSSPSFQPRTRFCANPIRRATCSVSAGSPSVDRKPLRAARS